MNYLLLGEQEALTAAEPGKGFFITMIGPKFLNHAIQWQMHTL